MNAMIRKELRENGKWALLLGAALAVCLFAALMEGGGHSYSIVNETSQLTTFVGFASLAAILAAAQTLPEQWRDRWAFLVHRPMTRTRILLAKALAGAALYLLACGVPLLLAAWWAARSPRLAAPFVPEMLQPALADLLGGLGFYVAALIVCLRRASWLGSRIMPLGVPLLAASLVFLLADGLTTAVVIHSAALLLLAPAAWGAFVSGGTYEPLPRVAKLAQLFAIVCGLSMLVASAGGLLTGVAEACFPRGRGASAYETYVMLRDGRIARTAYHDPTRGSTTLRTVDLSGKPIPELSSPQLADLDLTKHTYSFLPLTTARPEQESAIADRNRMLRTPARYLRQMPWATPSAVWYYLPTRGWIEGIEVRDPYLPRRAVARVGPGGFVGPGETPAPFDGPLLETQYNAHLAGDLIADRSAVYRVNARDRRIEKVYAAPEGETITGFVQSTHRSSDTDTSPEATFVATTKRIHVIPSPDMSAHPFDVPLHPMQAFRHVTVVYVKATNSAMVWYQGGLVDGRRDALAPLRLLAYDSAGNVVREQELPALNAALFAAGRGSNFQETPLYAAVSLADLAFMQATFWLAGERSVNDAPATAAVVIAVMALLSAAAGYFVARRHALAPSRRLVWAVGGLTFALPGVLTMLSLRETPARVPCPSCGRRRIVTRDACEHCGATFAPPPSDGTEIFE